MTLAALRTLEHLDLFDRRVVLAYVSRHNANLGNPNISDVACARYLVIAERQIARMLGPRVAVDPYLAAFRVLTGKVPA